MSRISSRLLTWYRKNGRTLPWRDHPNPYAIWVSEIMLQQTRVETVIPFFHKWMKLFPTIRKLAGASEQEVLNAWEGLGYYGRARNLHKAAKIVAYKYKAELPRNLEELRALPGIGRYTVGAIASMAFSMDEPTLDGNLRRVFARLFDLTMPADSTAGEKMLWEFATKHLPEGHAGDYNQALMDLGATICLPKNPHCVVCPLRGICKARLAGTQDQRPLLKPKVKPPHYVQVVGVIVKRGRALMEKRPSKGLLGGMWEFPNSRLSTRAEGDPAKEFARTLQKFYPLKIRKERELDVVKHAYSHFSLTVHPYLCELVSISANNNLRWITISKFEDYPMGRIDRQIAKQIQEIY